ncbi:MAG TPA: hypothetical protein VL329_09925 [Nitrospiraceae bacterium]|jgi:hypothetical protein|nr:hypothetical protein [Nitrospiraceae bacterium]HKN86509.1 hypothetical protein [Nitrospiraceae bacterium]HTK88040.1 hypothetical protein [Nitrospiraceae bacterium]
MKQLMVAAMAVMFLVGLSTVSFADEKGAPKTETKGDMKGDKKKDEKKGH